MSYDFVDETKPVSVAVPLSKLLLTQVPPNGPEWAMAMGQRAVVLSTLISSAVFKVGRKI